MLITFSEV